MKISKKEKWKNENFKKRKIEKIVR